MSCTGCPDKTEGTCCHQLIKPSSLITNIKQDLASSEDKRKDNWVEQYGGGLFDEIERRQRQ